MPSARWTENRRSAPTATYGPRRRWATRRGVHTQTNEALSDVTLALAVPKHYRTQPPPDVSVETGFDGSLVQVKKKPIHPRRYTFTCLMHASTDCPKFRGTSSRILVPMRSFERFDSSTSTLRPAARAAERKPTKCRSSGRATALLPRSSSGAIASR